MLLNPMNKFRVIHLQIGESEGKCAGSVVITMATQAPPDATTTAQRP
jgi:hypothetical protein